MRLDLLLEREPFPDVFTATLGDYLRYRLGWNGELRWQSGCRGGGLLVNEKLNLIFPASWPTQQLLALAAEYAYHPSYLRRLAQGLYVRYAVTRPFRWVLANHAITVEPWPTVLSDWCILPGNHSIRIVDAARDECVVLRKRGACAVRLKAAVDLRLAHPELPGPRILAMNDALGWYAEERIVGLPLNRVAAADRGGGAALAAARRSLAGLYTATAEAVSAQVWCTDLLHRIQLALDNLPLAYSSDVRARTLAAAESLAVPLLDGSLSVSTAMTHGDFQPANILIPQDAVDVPVYLIDWEYSGRRCRWYDALVFDLGSRFPSGLADRVHGWVADEVRSAAALLWCGGAPDGWSSKQMMATFLLDDLLLRIEDTTVVGLFRPAAGFLTFIEELNRLRWRSL